MFHNKINIIDMDKTSAQDPGHLGIGLAYDNISRFAGRKIDINGNAKTHPPKVVRRRSLDQRRI